MIIFIGQQPAGPSQPHEALTGISGRRLAKLVGIPYERFLLHPRMNVNARFPGARNGRGDGFDIVEGKKRAEEIRDILREGDVAVLCGLRVAKVFGLGSYKPMTICVYRGVWYLMMPHPSGRNRYWNSKEHREYCVQLFAQSWAQIL